MILYYIDNEIKWEINYLLINQCFGKKPLSSYDFLHSGEKYKYVIIHRCKQSISIQPTINYHKSCLHNFDHFWPAPRMCACVFDYITRTYNIILHNIILVMLYLLHFISMLHELGTAFNMYNVI